MGATTNKTYNYHFVWNNIMIIERQTTQNDTNDITVYHNNL